MKHSFYSALVHKRKKEKNKKSLKSQVKIQSTVLRFLLLSSSFLPSSSFFLPLSSFFLTIIILFLLSPSFSPLLLLFFTYHKNGLLFDWNRIEFKKIHIKWSTIHLILLCGLRIKVRKLILFITNLLPLITVILHVSQEWTLK